MSRCYVGKQKQKVDWASTLPAALANSTASALQSACRLPSATVRKSCCLGFAAVLLASCLFRAFLAALTLVLGPWVDNFCALGAAVCATPVTGACWVEEVAFAAVVSTAGAASSICPNLRFFLSSREARLTAGSTCNAFP